MPGPELSQSRFATPKGARFLLLLHYSRLVFVLLAGAMTAAVSSVLLGHLNWLAALLVALGTFTVYSVDNILDWHGERHLLHELQAVWKHYLHICGVLVPLAALCIIWIVQQHLVLVVVFAILGGVAIAQLFLTRQMPSQPRGSLALWVERFSDAAVWSLVTTLTPVIIIGAAFTPQVVMTILFILPNAWNVVMIWDATRAATNGKYHPTPVLTEKIGEQRLINYLQLCTLMTVFLTVVDILLGFFPWYNLVVLVIPGSHLILLTFHKQLRRRPVYYCNLFTLASCIGSFIIIGVYKLFG